MTKNLCQIGLDCPFHHYTEDGEPLCTFPDVEPKEGKEYRMVCNVHEDDCDLYPIAFSPLWDFMRFYKAIDRSEAPRKVRE